MLSDAAEGFTASPTTAAESDVVRLAAVTGIDVFRAGALAEVVRLAVAGFTPRAIAAVAIEVVSDAAAGVTVVPPPPAV